eukprot:364783-Chlamydomonas_euryale.AAC.13
MRRKAGLVSPKKANAADDDPTVARCCQRPGAPGAEACEHSDINYGIRGACGRIHRSILKRQVAEEYS